MRLIYLRQLLGWLMRLLGLLHRNQREQEFAEELASHLAFHIEDNLRAGLSPEEARRQALIKLGGVAQTQELYREQRGLPMLETLLQDLRFGWRVLRKNKVTTLIAVVTLALGLGANTAIFSVVNAVLLQPLPYENPGQLVRLWADNSGRRTEQNQFAPADITDFRDQLTTFEEVGLFDYGLSANLTGGAQPERVNASEASPGLFTVLGVNPLLGRTFLPSELEVGQTKVALISEGLWKRSFGADPNFAGRSIHLDGESFTVIGVLPGSFKFPEQVDLWLPFSFTAADWKNDREHYYVEAVGRLKPGVTLAQANAELETIVGRLRPGFPAARKNWGVTLVPLHEQVVGKVSKLLWILFGAVGFVLLIACVNVAHLLLARAAVRQKEMAIRAALGASRLRIVRQLLTESLLLAVAGGGAGILLAVGAVKLFAVALRDSLPRADEVTVNGWVLLFTLFVSVLTGVVFGLTPALQAANPHLNEMLKAGNRQATAMRSGLRNALVVAEIALSLVLMVGAGLLIRSFVRLQSVNAGFDPANLLTMQVTLPKVQYPDTEKQNAFVQQTLRRLETLPGVRSVAATINLPLVRAWGMGYKVINRDNAANQVADNANVTPNYFQTMGIPVLHGRDFSARDSTAGPPVIIISEALARKHFGNESPLGQRITAGGNREIVGVVADVRPRGLELDVKPQIYLPYAQKPTPASFVTFTVRTATAPLGLAASAANEIRNLDTDLPVANVRTMEQIVADSLAQRRLTMVLLSFFAGLAVVLTSIGIYGVVAYAVAQRTQELGIRLALGARPAAVSRLVIGEGMRLAFAGVTLGILAAWALTRLLQTLLFEVTATDLPTFGGIALLSVFVALLACWIPARRAALVDPMIALRSE